MILEKITANQFGIYVQPTRSRYANILAREVAWFKNEADTIFGVVLLDYQDQSYAGMLLARSKNLKVQFYKQQIGLKTSEEAVVWLDMQARILDQKPGFQTVQGWFLENRRANLFAETEGEGQLHPAFTTLRDCEEYAPAKELISRIMPCYRDIDDGFRRKFQTEGFDASLWELYLYCYASEEGMRLGRGYHAPHFCIRKGRDEIAMEAVTMGNVPHNGVGKEQAGKTEFMKDHDGKPFVLAIADVPGDGFMMSTASLLSDYLYGCDGDGRTPSGFFLEAGTEHISAVLCSTDELISKFNRIGRQCGYGGWEAAEAGGELWAEGIVVYHNPQALLPLPLNVFNFAAQKGYDGYF